MPEPPCTKTIDSIRLRIQANSEFQKLPQGSRNDLLYKKRWRRQSFTQIALDAEFSHLSNARTRKTASSRAGRALLQVSGLVRQPAPTALAGSGGSTSSLRALETPQTKTGPCETAPPRPQRRAGSCGSRESLVNWRSQLLTKPTAGLYHEP
jgi:hypothetical protein